MSVLAVVVAMVLPSGVSSASVAAPGAPVPGVWERVAPGASGDPVAVTAASDLYTDAFVRTGTSLLHQRYDDTGQVTENLGGILRSDPAAAVADAGTYVFAVGADDAVWYRLIDDLGAVSTWTSLGGIARRNPAATTAGQDGVVHLFAVGADDGVWTRRLTPGGWTPWESLGGIVTSDLSVNGFGGPGDGFVFLAARGTDGAAWRATRSNGTWFPFEDLGGLLLGAPELNGGHVGVIATGIDGQLWDWNRNHRWIANGGFIVGDPTYALTNDSSPHAYIARGQDDRVWIERWGQFSRTGWAPIDAIVTSRIAAATLGHALCDTPCGLRLYAVGADGALYTILPYGPTPT